ITGFREAPRLPYWVNAGVYVLGEEALERLPVRGDHERSTFPELARDGRLGGFRHEGLWLPINTPKDLLRAEEYCTAPSARHPPRARARSRLVARARDNRQARAEARRGARSTHRVPAAPGRRSPPSTRGACPRPAGRSPGACARTEGGRNLCVRLPSRPPVVP